MERLVLHAWARGSRRGAPAWVVLTPSFPASRCVVVLIADHQAGWPELVLKIPRLPGPDELLAREARNLQMLQEARAGGYPGVPRVVGLDLIDAWHVLTETGVAGRPIDPYVVRGSGLSLPVSVAQWILELPRADPSPDDDRRARLIETPLLQFAQFFGDDSREARLAFATVAMSRTVDVESLPVVFEHGDPSHPNLLRRPDASLGVVDWELADAAGFPVHDLVLFLTYILVAREQAWTAPRQRRGYQVGFGNAGAWARRLVDEHMRQLGLPPTAADALIALSWARYTANLLTRLLANDSAVAAAAGLETGPVGRTSSRVAVAPVIASSRQFVFWEAHLRHLGVLGEQR